LKYKKYPAMASATTTNAASRLFFDAYHATVFFFDATLRAIVVFLVMVMCYEKCSTQYIARQSITSSAGHSVSATPYRDQRKNTHHEDECLFLVSLQGSNWKTIWDSLERMSNRLEELEIDTECYNRED
jgi:hypothetical protein